MTKIYALDVGTRNVVLLSAEKTEENKIKINHVLSKEHETRAMEDGQIHDISKVAQVVSSLKKEMEEITKETIEEVAVAVAGRNLVTSIGKMSKDFNITYELKEDDIKAVELGAIQKAMENLNADSSEYHCVGYTVSDYILDSISLKNPLYQKGAKLEVEILATFLPKMVIDSMYTMIKKADLKVQSLTLEPIAAINVVIPEDMRKLNIALVDIGAGTSDIAITKNGKIIGYGMVPMAGDEVSEKIEQEYLLEFNVAERLKKDLLNKETSVSYEDILGFQMEVPKSEILEKIDSSLEELSTAIASKIAEVNEAPPQAVILIGGGSLIPNLKEKIAEKISLVAGRVAVRGTEAIKNLIDSTESLKTAEFVTPIGIANMAFDKKGFNVLELTINNESHRIFSFQKELSLMEALLATGIGTKTLYSKPGNPLTYEINNKLFIEKGELGKVSTIKINSHNKSLESIVKNGDIIEIIKNRDGRDAILFGKDLIQKHSKIKLTIDGKEIEFYNKLYKNKILVDDEYKVKDRDSFEVEESKLSEFQELKTFKKLRFTLNGKEHNIEIPIKEIYKDGILVSSKEAIANGSVYTSKIINDTKLKVKDIIDTSIVQEKFQVNVNDFTIEFKDVQTEIYINGQKSNIDEEIKTNDLIEVKIPEEKRPIVSDIFKYYNPQELLEQKHGFLTIELNGEKGEFTSPLNHNDSINFIYK